VKAAMDQLAGDEGGSWRPHWRPGRRRPVPDDREPLEKLGDLPDARGMRRRATSARA